MRYKRIKDQFVDAEQWRGINNNANNVVQFFILYKIPYAI